MKLKALACLVCSIALSACGTTSTPTTPVTPTGSTASAAIEAALPLVRTGAAVATGAVLDFAVKQASTRTKLANEMYASASAIYSMTGTGTFPTVAQFQANILAFGGTQADANYAQYSSAMSALYASYYPKLTANPNVKTATDLLNAIAGGVEDATQSYVTTPAPSVSSTGSPQTSDAALRVEQAIEQIRMRTAMGGFTSRPPRFKITTGLRPIYGWRDPYNVQLAKE